MQTSKKINSENNPEKEENIMSEKIITTETTTETAPVEATEITATEVAPAVEVAPEETAQEVQEEQDEAPTGNREAAKFRRRARDAEAALEAVTGDLSNAREELLRIGLKGYVVEVHEQTSDGGSRKHLYPFNHAAVQDAGISHDVFDGVNIDPDRIDAEMRALLKSKPYMFGNPRAVSTLGSAESARLSKLIEESTKRPGDWENAFKTSK